MSVRGRAAAPAVDVEADTRTADPVAVAACEDVVCRDAGSSANVLAQDVSLFDTDREAKL